MNYLNLKKSLLALTVAGTFAAPAAEANINLRQITPTTNSRYTNTESAIPERPATKNWLSYRHFFGSLTYSYLNDPLVELDSTRTQRLGVLVGNIQTLDLGAGVEWNGIASLNLAVPMHLVQIPGTRSQFGMGDIRFFPKFYLLDDSAPVRVSLIPEIIFPTGNTELFVGDNSWGWGLTAAVEHDFGPVAAAFNLGYRQMTKAFYQNINYRQKVPMSLGVTVPLGKKWRVNTEASGALVLPLNSYQNPGELYVGGMYNITPDMTASLGGAIGSVNQVSSSDFRIQAGIKFAPFSVDEKPIVVKKAAPKPKKKPRVVFTKKKIKIFEEVKFKHNSDIILSSGKNLLNEVANVIKKNTKNFKYIRVDGHTNSIGRASYNLKLSKRRARAVREYLSGRGINPKLLRYKGYGESRPKKLAKGISKKARQAANRRVEFTVIN